MNTVQSPLPCNRRPRVRRVSVPRRAPSRAAIHQWCGSPCRAADHCAVRRPPVMPVSVPIHQCCTPSDVVVDLAVDSSMQARRWTVLRSDSSAWQFFYINTHISGQYELHWIMSNRIMYTTVHVMQTVQNCKTTTSHACVPRGAVPCMHAMPHNTVQTEITALNQTWYETVRNHTMVQNHATCRTTRHITVQNHANCTTA